MKDYYCSIGADSSEPFLLHHLPGLLIYSCHTLKPSRMWITSYSPPYSYQPQCQPVYCSLSPQTLIFTPTYMPTLYAPIPPLAFSTSSQALLVFCILLKSLPGLGWNLFPTTNNGAHVLCSY